MDSVLNSTAAQCEAYLLLLDAAVKDGRGDLLSSRHAAATALLFINALDDIQARTVHGFVCLTCRRSTRPSPRRACRTSWPLFAGVRFNLRDVWPQLLRYNYVELGIFVEMDGATVSAETRESLVSDALIALRSNIGARAFRDMVAAQNFPLQDFVHDAETRSEMLDVENQDGADEDSVILKLVMRIRRYISYARRSLSEDAGREAYELLIVCCWRVCLA